MSTAAQHNRTNSLGFTKAPRETRVVVAMSGGVDSSVTAALLKDEGYDVIGITLQLYDHGEAIQRANTCCAGQDIHDARRVADHIGIPHYVLDFEDVFRNEVMEEFAESYLRGETPIPCVKCNQTVKFRDLFQRTLDLGGEALATGHYVRRQEGPQGPVLLRGRDPNKDQSYFLYATTREQLELLRFPLGGMTKDETRALAQKYDLPVASKNESQDICFVPNGRYQDVVEKLRPGALDAGEIVHVDGRVLGEHDGIINFTVGQRRGIKIGGTDPLYVIRLEPETNRVVVGPKEALLKTGFAVHEVNWLGDQALSRDGTRVLVKTRYGQRPVPGLVYKATTDRARIVLDAPLGGIAPGQAGVFYDEADADRVLGGGWIVRDDAGAARAA